MFAPLRLPTIDMQIPHAILIESVLMAVIFVIFGYLEVIVFALRETICSQKLTELLMAQFDLQLFSCQRRTYHLDRGEDFGNVSQH